MILMEIPDKLWWKVQMLDRPWQFGKIFKSFQGKLTVIAWKSHWINNQWCAWHNLHNINMRLVSLKDQSLISARVKIWNKCQGAYYSIIYSTSPPQINGSCVTGFYLKIDLKFDIYFFVKWGPFGACSFFELELSSQTFHKGTIWGAGYKFDIYFFVNVSIAT